jgi:hypothetical protein
MKATQFAPIVALATVLHSALALAQAAPADPLDAPPASRPSDGPTPDAIALDAERARAPSVERPATVAPLAIPPVGAIAPYTTHERLRRSTSLFGAVALGIGDSPGINPYFILGANVAATLRSLWSGLLLDAGMDLVFNGMALGGGSGASFLELRPSLRIGYQGAVSPRVALGVRAGYAPSLVFARYNPPGFLHQVDADLHVSVVTTRGMLVEPYLAGGVLIANPTLPIGLLGVRLGLPL